MIIVGGTYAEYCRFPNRSRIMGSGFRAAAALSQADSSLQLISSIDADSRSEAEQTSASFSFQADWQPRSGRIEFDYFTPLTSPHVLGERSVSEELVFGGQDEALVFGMLESRIRGSADFVVFDPQRPRDTSGSELSRIQSQHLAIVANSVETAHLGEDPDPLKAAKNVLHKYNADVVITKRGARGVLVTTARFQEEIGAHPTASVMPIGSGDIFSAGFAWAWAKEKFDPIESAQIASAATATYVFTETLPLRKGVLTDRAHLAPALAPRDVRIYLAGPFFTMPEYWLVDSIESAVRDLGASVFSPLHEIGLGGDEVVAKDVAGLRECNGVLALLDHLDPGTVFEIGWATRFGLPIVVYIARGHSEGLKMIRGTGAEIYDDLSTAVYRAIWRAMGAEPIK